MAWSSPLALCILFISQIRTWKLGKSEGIFDLTKLISMLKESRTLLYWLLTLDDCKYFYIYIASENKNRTRKVEADSIGYILSGNRMYFNTILNDLILLSSPSAFVHAVY